MTERTAPTRTPLITHLVRAAWVVWVAACIAVCVVVFKDSTGRSVTGNYEDASRAFVASRPVYDLTTEDGWIYLPGSAAAYAPFAVLPEPWGDVLWRIAMTGVYAWGLWRFARLVCPRASADKFPLLTLLCLPIAAGALRNGQTNILLAGMFMLAAANIAAGRWWSGALQLGLALLGKPPAVVYWLLALALHPRMRIALIVALLIGLALPFVHLDWSYVIQTHKDGVAKVLQAGKPVPGRFSDLTGLLTQIGLTPPPLGLTALRAGAALATLGACWLAVKRLGAREGAIVTFILATTYLMLFNPRTEGVSYNILMPGVGALLCYALDHKAWGRAALLGAVSAVVIAGHVIFGMNYWARPLVTLVFGAFTVWCLLRAIKVPPASAEHPRAFELAAAGALPIRSAP
jgi:alpha-1,2-mannosyltransferase